jgi:ketosteroid isomerase-like protein
MMTAGWIDDLFRTIDDKNADAFAGFLAPDATFQFGNAPPVAGRDAIRETVRQFFAGVQALRHELLETWMVPDGAICRGHVTYLRHDGSRLAVPFANVFRLRGGLVKDYLIYVDASQLFAPR